MTVNQALHCSVTYPPLEVPLVQRLYSQHGDDGRMPFLDTPKQGPSSRRLFLEASVRQQEHSFTVSQSAVLQTKAGASQRARCRASRPVGFDRGTNDTTLTTHTSRRWRQTTCLLSDTMLVRCNTVKPDRSIHTRTDRQTDRQQAPAHHHKWAGARSSTMDQSAYSTLRGCIDRDAEPRQLSSNGHLETAWGWGLSSH